MCTTIVMRLVALIFLCIICSTKTRGKAGKRGREREREEEREKKNPIKKKIWCTTIVMHLVPLIAHGMQGMRRACVCSGVYYECGVYACERETESVRVRQCMRREHVSTREYAHAGTHASTCTHANICKQCKCCITSMSQGLKLILL